MSYRKVRRCRESVARIGPGSWYRRAELPTQIWRQSENIYFNFDLRVKIRLSASLYEQTD